MDDLLTPRSDVVFDSKRERIFLADRSNPTTYICTNMWLLSAWVKETSTEDGCKAWQNTSGLEKWPPILLKLGAIFGPHSPTRRDVLQLLWNLIRFVEGFSVALADQGNEWFKEMIVATIPTSAKHLQSSGLLSVLGIVRQLQEKARIKLVNTLSGTWWVKSFFQMCQGYLDPKSSLARDATHDECAVFAHAAITTLKVLAGTLFLRKGGSNENDSNKQNERSGILAQLFDADVLNFVCSLFDYAQRNDDNGASSRAWIAEETPFSGDRKCWAVEQACVLMMTCCSLARGLENDESMLRTQMSANVLRNDRGVLSRLLRQMKTEVNPASVTLLGVAVKPICEYYDPSPSLNVEPVVRELLLKDEVFATKVVGAMRKMYGDSIGKFTGDGVPKWSQCAFATGAREAVVALRAFAKATGAPGLEQIIGGGALDVTKNFVIKYLDFSTEKRRSINGGTYEDKIGHFLVEALGFFGELASGGDLFCEAIFDLETMQKFRAVDQSFLSSLVTKRVRVAIDTAQKSFETACPSLYYKRQGELSKTDGEVKRLRELESANLKAVRDELGITCPLPSRPLEHFCPLTEEVMVDPVMLGDGYFYEREALEKFFAEREENDKTSPMTGEKMPPLAPDGVTMVQSKKMKSLIDEWERESHRACVEMHDAIMAALEEEVKRLKESKKGKNKGKKRASDSDLKPKKKKKKVVTEEAV